MQENFADVWNVSMYLHLLQKFGFYENEHNYAHGDETTDRLRNWQL